MFFVKKKKKKKKKKKGAGGGGGRGGGGKDVDRSLLSGCHYNRRWGLYLEHVAL